MKISKINWAVTVFIVCVYRPHRQKNLAEKMREHRKQDREQQQQNLDQRTKKIWNVITY